MEHMDTMTDAIAELEAEGYIAQLSIDGAGRIVGQDGSWSPEQVDVERTVRLEGMSNPDDEAIIMAIRTSSGVCGTLVLPYGPDLSGIQADTVRALATRS